MASGILPDAIQQKGMSSHQLHRALGITYKSAWFLFFRNLISVTQTAWRLASTTGNVQTLPSRAQRASVRRIVNLTSKTFRSKARKFLRWRAKLKKPKGRPMFQEFVMRVWGALWPKPKKPVKKRKPLTRHPSLDRAIARISRAEEHLADLMRRTALRGQEQVNAMAIQPHPNEPKQILIKRGEVPLDHGFSILVGEIVYNLRSALDYPSGNSFMSVGDLMASECFITFCCCQPLPHIFGFRFSP
jgi:hypothetical protein